MESAVKKNVVYLPGINGLRAIAALAVVVTHITRSLGSFHLNPNIFGSFENGSPEGLDLAGYGVSIFFSISGFLITYLLLLEKENGVISVKKFYLRRILRIWPLYYFYLGISLIILYAVHEQISFYSLLFYLFYAANIPFALAIPIKFVAHYWSLGIEEQFYIFWPWFMKKINSFVIPLLLLLIFILISIKIYVHVFYLNSYLDGGLQLARFQCMMIGALGAMIFYKKNNFILNLIDNKISQAICLLILLIVSINRFHIISILDHEIICVVTVFLIIGQVNVKNRIISFDGEVFDFLGKISYGIYVIHPLIIFGLISILGDVQLNVSLKYILVFGSAILLTILIAFLSYKYFESKFLKLKKRFTIVKSSGSKHFS